MFARANIHIQGVQKKYIYENFVVPFAVMLVRSRKVTLGVFTPMLVMTTSSTTGHSGYILLESLQVFSKTSRENFC